MSNGGRPTDVRPTPSGFPAVRPQTAGNFPTTRAARDYFVEFHRRNQPAMVFCAGFFAGLERSVCPLGDTDRYCEPSMEGRAKRICTTAIGLVRGQRCYPIARNAHAEAW